MLYHVYRKSRYSKMSADLLTLEPVGFQEAKAIIEEEKSQLSEKARKTVVVYAEEVEL